MPTSHDGFRYHAGIAGGDVLERSSRTPYARPTTSTRPTYVPRHKQLLLNPTLSQQSSLHVGVVEAPSAALDPPRRKPLKKLVIGQPVLSYSSNPDVKVPVVTTPSSGKPMMSDTTFSRPSAAATSLPTPPISPATNRQPFASASTGSACAATRRPLGPVKRKPVPKYDEAEIVRSNSSSSSSKASSSIATSAEHRAMQHQAAEDQLVGEFRRVSMEDYQKPTSTSGHRDPTVHDLDGLGLSMSTSPTTFEARLTSRMVDPWPSPLSRDRSSHDLISSPSGHSFRNDHQIRSTPFEVNPASSRVARTSSRSSPRLSTSPRLNDPPRSRGDASKRTESLLDSTVRQPEESPEERLEAWRVSMADVEAERQKNRLEAQSRRGSVFAEETDASSLRRPSSISRSSSYADYTSHDSSSSSPGTSHSGRSWPNRTSIGSASSRPFALVNGRTISSSTAASGVCTFPTRSLAASDHRRKSSIALKTHRTGVVSGDDSLLDIWVELMGGEVAKEIGSPIVPFPSRKRGPSGSGLFGKHGLRPASRVAAGANVAGPKFGAEAIIPMYSSLPPLVYASNQSSQSSRSVPALSENGDETDPETASEDWASAHSHARSSTEYPSSDSRADSTSVLADYAWPTTKAPHLVFEQHSLRSPDFVLHPASVSSTPALSATPTFAVGAYCTSPPQEPSTPEEPEESLLLEPAVLYGLDVRRSSSPMLVPPPRPVKSTRRASKGDMTQAMLGSQQSFVSVV